MPEIKICPYLTKESWKARSKKNKLFPRYTIASENTVSDVHCFQREMCCCPYRPSFLCNTSSFFGCFSALAGGIPGLCDLGEFFLMIPPGGSSRGFGWFPVTHALIRTHRKTQGRPSAEACLSALWALATLMSKFSSTPRINIIKWLLLFMCSHQLQEKMSQRTPLFFLTCKFSAISFTLWATVFPVRLMFANACLCSGHMISPRLSRQTFINSPCVKGFYARAIFFTFYITAFHSSITYFVCIRW